MPHWDDEFQLPYLPVGSVSPAGPLHGSAKPRPKKKFPIGFQIPAPPKPKPKKKRKGKP